MTEADLQAIETALGIALPGDYRRTMLEYPFEPDSFANDCELPDDAERVIATNHELRANGFFGQHWPARYFSFGGDGSGNEYFVDLDMDASPVFLADHEGSSHEHEANDFSSWLEQRKREYAEWDAEDREREARRGSKRWWQFWRPGRGR